MKYVMIFVFILLITLNLFAERMNISPNDPIPDFGQLQDYLSFPWHYEVKDVNVKINITHPWTSDLDITLTHDGVTVELTSDNGSSGDNYTNTIFDDDASNSIITGTAPFTGTFVPEGDLNDFNGLMSSGHWILEITDDATNDTGTLVSWSISIPNPEPEADNCLDFDGSDDYTILNPMNNFPSTELSVEFWLKTGDTTNNGTPFSYAAALPQDNEFLIYNYRNIEIYIDDVSSGATGVSFNDGLWHHLAVTWNSSDGALVLYKDGVPEYTGNHQAGSSLVNGGSLVFGQDQDSVGGGFDPTQALNGQLDEVCLWNTVRSETEIQGKMYASLSGDEPGLMHYWQFNRSSGTTAIDEVSFMDLALNNMSNADWVTNNMLFDEDEDTDDFKGNCLEFDGSDDYVTILSDSSFQPENNFTIEAWIKPEDVSTNQVILMHDENGGGDDGYALSISGGYAIFGAHTGAAQYITSDESLVPGEWNHIAAVYYAYYSTRTIKIYVNGTEKTQAGSGDVVYTEYNHVNIGRRGGTHLPNTSLFTGQMDEVKFWSTALSAGDITSGMNTTLTGDEEGLAGYWQFNESEGNIAFDSDYNKYGLLHNMTDDDWVTSTAPIGMLGSGTELDPYQIATISDLRWISENQDVWYNDNFFIQVANIDANSTSGWNSSQGFSPIGNEWYPFNGNYDGQNHTISNLYINRQLGDDNGIGLFGNIEYVTISNLGLTDIDITGDVKTGGLAGKSMFSDFNNCYTTGYLDSSYQNYNFCGGGLVGFDQHSDFTDCYSTVGINEGNFDAGGEAAGGLIAYVQGNSNITNCYSTGTIIGGNNTGGLTGFSSNSYYDNCYCTASSVTGGNHTGGLTGYSHNDSYTDCYTDVYVTGNEYVGGLIGKFDTPMGFGCYDNYSMGTVYGQQYIGGFAGYLATGDMSQVFECYSTGDVFGNDFVGGFLGTVKSYSYPAVSRSFCTGNVSGDDNIGGFAGSIGLNDYESADVLDCYCLGDVTGTNYSGGFAGSIYQLSFANSCYSVGSVTPGEWLNGGFAGSDEWGIGGDAYNCFWNTETSGYTTSYGGTGKTTAQMKTASTFTDAYWDFTWCWGIDGVNNSGYPYFQWEDYPPVVLDAPQNLTIDNSGGTVAISWDAVTNANSYKVYSSDFPYEGFTLDTSGYLTGTSWSAGAAPGDKFYYVKACSDYLRNDGSSEVSSGKSKKPNK